MAFVVPRPGSVLSETEILDFLETRLARYKLPRAIYFSRFAPRHLYGQSDQGRAAEVGPRRAVVLVGRPIPTTGLTIGNGGPPR